MMRIHQGKGGAFWLRTIAPFLAVLAMLLGVSTVTAMATRESAMANGSYNNADIATDALTHVGEKYGQCWPFVRDMVYQASSHTQDISAAAGGNDYFAHLQNAGGTRITNINALSKGDVVQEGEYGGHTFIIVSKVSVSGSTATYNVVDSNHAYDDKVMNYNRTFSLSNDERAYRFGTVGSSGSGVGNAAYKGGDTLRVNVGLYQNQYIMSPDGQYVLLMQTDGNLVLFGPGSKPIWESNTGGTGAGYFVVQADGDFVGYMPNGQTAVWANNKSGSGSNNYVVIQSDGNFVEYQSNGQTAVWATNTAGKI